MKTAEFKKFFSRYSSFSLDTSCFIYYFEDYDGYGELTAVLFSYLEEKELNSFASVLAVGELLAKKEIQEDPVRVASGKELFITMPGLTLVPVDFSIVSEAAGLRVMHNLQLIDAVHLATAERNGAEVFVTNDSHFKGVEKPDVLLLDDFV